MKSTDLIIGLFFSNEENLIFDKIKISGDLTDENKNQIMMLPYRFLGPLFLTSASSSEPWKIEFIESTLSLLQGRSHEADIIQSFFSLNSTIESGEEMTHLFALIGSPFTEDTKIIHDKLMNYIHPSIVQGRTVKKHLLGSAYKFQPFIKKELERGLDIIEYSLGTSRKIYWEEQQKYYCIGIIERNIEKDSKISFLYTFEKDNPLRRQILAHFPSFYIMAILPDYYESLIRETLISFGKTSIFPNIRNIKLSLGNQIKNAVYMEEFIIEGDSKKSYGVILIPEVEDLEETKNISFYKRNLRLILDANKGLPEILEKINPQFILYKWGTSSEEELNKIRSSLDN